MQTVHGTVHHYAWGDRTSIPDLLGEPADGTPWAEVWWGTHPGGPGVLGDGTPLRDEAGDLPYLLKVLAAAEPLSLQTHPDAATARAGFDHENAAGIPLDAPHRVFRDRNAKPEVLCALTPFDALCGFRPVDASLCLLRMIGAISLADHLAAEGLEATVVALYRGTVPVEPVIDACRATTGPEAALVTRLAAHYPGDPSVAVTLLLNRVTLQPGEAIYLTPGNLHAYLTGVGVEVMGASDNVLRGGLTPKHVDVDQLLQVLSYEPLDEPVVRPQRLSEGVHHYPTPGAPFALVRFDIVGHMAYTAEGRDLLLCTDGHAGTVRRGECVYLDAGESAMLLGPSTVWSVTGG
jgi:mannose-6-phosphate isomerase